MAFLDGLPPSQRTALLIGVPVVAIAAIVTAMRPAPEPAPEPDEALPPEGTIPGAMMPTTDAIGTGTLAEWANQWAEILSGLTGRVTDLEERPQATPPPASTTPANPKAPHLQGDALGRRRYTVKQYRPTGRQISGQTPSELARDLYGDRAYWNYIRFFNNALWPGSPDHTIPAGKAISY